MDAHFLDTNRTANQKSISGCLFLVNLDHDLSAFDISHQTKARNITDDYRYAALGSFQPENVVIREQPSVSLIESGVSFLITQMRQL